ncbi:hypothetical protein [Streptomyces sp. NRRL F-5527]|uniref:hypothetical protein n=1 Tax=Streptomyces TaxID=1883 RepID=UPI0004C724A2|nr:hypothetical protein [Streptomyces sp. NRRL F-5527]
MSKQQTPEEIERTAAEDVLRADQTLADLEQRVLDDDPDVTPAEIETARSARHFAGLRLQAAQRKAAALRKQQLAAEREKALAAARQILAQHPRTEVDEALKAAGEAMAVLREKVRAYNDAAGRAYALLQASPVEPVNPGGIRHRGDPLPVYPALGHGQRDGKPILWVDGRNAMGLDERQLLDAARAYPSERDGERAAVEQEAARRRGVERDAALYREDRAAFEQLPAVRRKPALDALGIDWQQHLDERERALKLQAQGV